MLRKADSLPSTGRSHDLKKYKGYHDTEVKFLKTVTSPSVGFLCEQ